MVPPFCALAVRAAPAARFGMLVPDPEGILDLPAGFSYRVLERVGDAMDDGYVVPGRPDAMGCFPGPPGTWVVLRNHELSPGDERAPFPPDRVPPEAYDPVGVAGVTRIVVDAVTLERRSSNLVLTGTARNCAGGKSPWGWLSCEETELEGHGYVFLCPADAEVVQPARRIVGYGRMFHEAAVVDPVTHVAYITEDRSDGALYRFLPDDPAEPFIGRLQALAVVDQPGIDLGAGLAPGQSFAVRWVDAGDPDPPDGGYVRTTARANGAAIFRRGEGICLDGGDVIVTCTSGGAMDAGQVFRLRPDGDAGVLELVIEIADPEVLAMPDNVTVAPWGDLVICEDKGGDNYVRVLAADGTVSDLARNALSNSELAGVCFSPDGRAMFVNIQEEGLTLIVSGPFSGAGAETGDGGDTFATTAGSETGSSTTGTGEGSTTAGESGASASADAGRPPPDLGGEAGGHDTEDDPTYHASAPSTEGACACDGSAAGRPTVLAAVLAALGGFRRGP